MAKGLVFPQPDLTLGFIVTNEIFGKSIPVVQGGRRFRQDLNCEEYLH
jgi:hypothetical protein